MTYINLVQHEWRGQTIGIREWLRLYAMAREAVQLAGVFAGCITLGCLLILLFR